MKNLFIYNLTRIYKVVKRLNIKFFRYGFEFETHCFFLGVRKYYPRILEIK